MSSSTQLIAHCLLKWGTGTSLRAAARAQMFWTRLWRIRSHIFRVLPCASALPSEHALALPFCPTALTLPTITPPEGFLIALKSTFEINYSVLSKN
jgi:hypothetical protein